MAAIGQPGPPPWVVHMNFLGPLFAFVSSFQMAYFWSKMQGVLFSPEGLIFYLIF